MRRYIITISLPQGVKDELDQAVRNGGYATRSEFMRMLFRFWQKEQSAPWRNKVSRTKKVARRGGKKILRSLKDLR